MAERELTAEERERAEAVKGLVLKWRDWDDACDSFRVLDDSHFCTPTDERTRAARAVASAIEALVRELGDAEAERDTARTVADRCFFAVAAVEKERDEWKARAEKAEAEVGAVAAVLDHFAPLPPGGPVALGERVRREMADLAMVVDHASRVFAHVTGGRISKPNTFPDIVCDEADEHYTRLDDEYRRGVRWLDAAVERGRGVVTLGHTEDGDVGVWLDQGEQSAPVGVGTTAEDALNDAAERSDDADEVSDG